MVLLLFLLFLLLLLRNGRHRLIGNFLSVLQSPLLCSDCLPPSSAFVRPVLFVRSRRIQTPIKAIRSPHPLTCCSPNASSYQTGTLEVNYQKFDIRHVAVRRKRVQLKSGYKGQVCPTSTRGPVWTLAGSRPVVVMMHNLIEIVFPLPPPFSVRRRPWENWAEGDDGATSLVGGKFAIDVTRGRGSGAVAAAKPLKP